MFALQFMFNTSCFGYEVGLNFLQILDRTQKASIFDALKRKRLWNVHIFITLNGQESA